MARSGAATALRLQRATGELGTAAIARMDETLPWFKAMDADSRSGVGLVAQAGVSAFVQWFNDPAQATTGNVFASAPRDLIRAVNLQQTVELIRITIGVVEENVDELAAPGEELILREAVLRYSREIAFAAAEVYAEAAESRGAWDARLEALVVDALLRGEMDDTLPSRAAALGWTATDGVMVVVGSAPDDDPETVVEGVQRAARHARLSVLAGVQGERLVAVLGGVRDSGRAAKSLVGQFAPGPIVSGPIVDDLGDATASAREALAALRVAAAWPDAPRPSTSDSFLPERVLAGDANARDRLVREVYRPLADDTGALLETAATFLERAPTIEGAARALIVHPNTVRYRLRRVADTTGLIPTNPRDALTLRLAIALGRLQGQPNGSGPPSL
jgi:DNA-binding PucR family transcriptional regulator